MGELVVEMQVVALILWERLEAEAQAGFGALAAVVSRQVALGGACSAGLAEAGAGRQRGAAHFLVEQEEAPPVGHLQPAPT